MEQLTDSENQFVVRLLTDLRNEKFGFQAWAHFLRISWERSRDTAKANPSLKRSWAYTMLLVILLALIMSSASFIFEGPNRALRLLPGFLFCVAWQQSDLFWHLGLNRHIGSGKLLPVVGTANTLTWLRGLGASFLFGRLVGGIGTPSRVALLILLSGIITDILDGLIARRTQTQSKLGQIADGEMDCYFYVAIALILIRNNILPIWFGVIILLRFLIPLIATLSSYLLFARPVRFGSTIWGKYAGMALCLLYLVLLAPGELIHLTSLINLPILIATLILLTIAPFAQIVRNVKDSP
jgi:CDP-diacylglycerol--glycerol-3-phosphate 3-phosphatidyltransferase